MFTLPGEKFRKYVADHAVAFLLGLSVAGLPAVKMYFDLLDRYEKSTALYSQIEKDRAAARAEADSYRLEIERLAAQLSASIESATQSQIRFAENIKTSNEKISAELKQIEAERKQLQEAWGRLREWGSKLSVEQEHRALVEDFTKMGVYLRQCFDPAEREKYERARLVARRILYAAKQTAVPENIEFARSIQPAIQSYSCR